jgi:hypothetical protein
MSHDGFFYVGIPDKVGISYAVPSAKWMLTRKIVLLFGIGCAVILASAKDAKAYPKPVSTDY